MARKHTRDDILASAVATASDGGLSRLSFGRVARRLGIPDRTVVYYFPTKDLLVGEVLRSLGAELQQTLADAVPNQRRDHRELLRAAWPVLAHADADRVFALFFEAVGLAATGQSPYAEAVPQLVAAWVAWAARLLPGSDKERQVEAETTVAIADGLLLLRQLAGPDAAERAARRLGINATD